MNAAPTRPSPWLIFAITSLAVFAVMLDSLVLLVALPAIQASFASVGAAPATATTFAPIFALTFLIPGVVGGPLPASFAAPGAYGDLLTVGLTFLALFALQARWRGALALVWLFALVGLLDFINAFVQGLQSDIAAQYALGPGWFIPTFAVPAFTIAHRLVIWLLVARGQEHRAARGGANLMHAKAAP